MSASCATQFGGVPRYRMRIAARANQAKGKSRGVQTFAATNLQS